jgi:hypothetical protein
MANNRRPRIDSTAARARVISQSAVPVSPPSNVPLDKEDMPFFASVIAEYARSEWSEHELELAAILARKMCDVEREQRLLRAGRFCPFQRARQSDPEPHALSRSALWTPRSSPCAGLWRSTHAQKAATSATSTSAPQSPRKSKPTALSETTFWRALIDDDPWREGHSVHRALLRVPDGVLVGKPIKLLEFQRKFILEVYDNPVPTRRAISALGARTEDGADRLPFAGTPCWARGAPQLPDHQRRSIARAGFVGLQARQEDGYALAGAKQDHPSGPVRKELYGLPMNVEYKAISAEAGTAHGFRRLSRSSTKSGR